MESRADVLRDFHDDHAPAIRHGAEKMVADAMELMAAMPPADQAVVSAQDAEQAHIDAILAQDPPSARIQADMEFIDEMYVRNAQRHATPAEKARKLIERAEREAKA